MNESAFDHYFKHIDDVEGWLSKTTAILSNRLMRHQSTGGLVGPICEIGIHHGKYLSRLPPNCAGMNKPSRSIFLRIRKRTSTIRAWATGTCSREMSRNS
ncbi:hypothetical protein [Afipia carboxidovorans]|uniref:hypothetical protein n=1 Tax=Afipia carboxidovorans TaxID=40137 RepID=UPI0011D21BFD|nr:hypothetical protein [Afipia carboxidovorans]